MATKSKEAVGMSNLVASRSAATELFLTDFALPGHSQVKCVTPPERKPVDSVPPIGVREPFPLVFAQVYEEHFDFVWRSARRLGVPQAQVDDAVQEVFLVVHRRLSEFEARSSLKTWLFAITRRVVADHRRSARRKPSESIGSFEPAAHARYAADAQLERDEEARLLYSLLDELDADKREVFVLAELEQVSGPEIALALGENLNTVYARLRAARSAFEAAVARHQARDRRAR